MEREKYYTPTIEEFHVGFEFEHLLKKPIIIWKKEIFGENGLYDLQDPILYNSLRVKYLDKEDLKSLEFETGSIYKNYYYYIIDDSIHYKLKFDPETLKVIVIIVEGPYCSYKKKVLFEGIIKNKSELVRLFKQINIIYDR